MSSTPMDHVLAESWEETFDAMKRFIGAVFDAGSDGVFTEHEQGQIAVCAVEVLAGADGHQIEVNRTTTTISLGRTLFHASADSDWFFRKLTEHRKDIAGIAPANEMSPDPRQRIEALIVP